MIQRRDWARGHCEYRCVLYVWRIRPLGPNEAVRRQIRTACSPSLKIQKSNEAMCSPRIFDAFGSRDDVYKVRYGDQRPDGRVEYEVWRGRRNEAGVKVFEEAPLDPAIWLPAARYIMPRCRVVKQLPPASSHPSVHPLRHRDGREGLRRSDGHSHGEWGRVFDDRYVGNPLVFCGCIGLLPRHLIKGEAKPGDRIVAKSPRTRRNGIHGATFSSAELESTASTEFAHAVQIGNAIEEKRLLDAIMRARDYEPDTPSEGREDPRWR